MMLTSRNFHGGAAGKKVVNRNASSEIYNLAMQGALAESYEPLSELHLTGQISLSLDSSERSEEDDCEDDCVL